MIQDKKFLIYARNHLRHMNGDFQFEWQNLLSTQNQIYFLSARDFGKSETITVDWTLWNIVEKRHRQIIFFSATDRQASYFLDRVKDKIDSLRDLSWLKPEKAEIWGRHEIKCANGVRIITLGFDSDKRGLKGGLLVGDDICSDKNSDTQSKRDAMFKHFVEEISYMRTRSPKSQILMIGTCIDEDDLLHRLKKNTAWTGVTNIAILDDDKKQVLWEERYTYQELKDKQAEDLRAFLKEMQCKPQRDVGSIFSWNHLERCKDYNYIVEREAWPGFTYFQGIDFSRPGSQRDWTASVIIKLDKFGIYSFISFIKMRGFEMTGDDQLTRIKVHYYNYKVSFGLAEENNFQRLYVDEFKKENLRIKGFTTTKDNKSKLIGDLRLLIERGKFVVPYAPDSNSREMSDKVLGELNETNYDDHTPDIVMATLLAIEASRQGTQYGAWSSPYRIGSSQKRVIFPFNSTERNRGYGDN